MLNEKWVHTMVHFVLSRKHIADWKIRGVMVVFSFHILYLKAVPKMPQDQDNGGSFMYSALYALP